jgi:hypothetical protein
MRKRLASPRGRVALAAVVACLAVLLSFAALGASDVRSGDRLAFALTGGRVIAAPGRVFDRGVIVVRGGVIEAVGAEGAVSIPADARVYDVKVDGRPLDLSDKHKRLYERYRNRPKPGGGR